MGQTGYDPSLVVLSVVIAILASYTALDLAGHVRNRTAGRRWTWVAAASLAMGGGIWSMHFVGMLAFRMAMPVLYDLCFTGLGAHGALPVVKGSTSAQRCQPDPQQG